jgi:hypothetical protein
VRIPNNQEKAMRIESRMSTREGSSRNMEFSLTVKVEDSVVDFDS